MDYQELFKDIEHSGKNIQKKIFKKHQVITTYIQKRKQICILINGEADLVRYDSNGNKTIIEHFIKNDIFGDAFYVVTTNNELSVEARTNCELLIIPMNKLKENPFLFQNFSDLIINKVTSLNTRVEILTKRSIREKLRGYFNILSSRNLSKTFYIPFSLTDLADYLSVDRSAMMREIKALVDDGIIEKIGKKITLLY